MSGEELKDLVRLYAEEHFGNRWDVASVMVTIPATGQAETLVIVRDRPGNGRGPRVREAPQHILHPSSN